MEDLTLATISQFIVAEVAVITVVVGIIKWMQRGMEKRLDRIEKDLQPHLRESTGIQKDISYLKRAVFNGKHKE